MDKSDKMDKKEKNIRIICPIRSVQTACLQHGHVLACSNQGFIHFSWNSWLQGSFRPEPSFSWHIAHYSFIWTFCNESIFYSGTDTFSSSSLLINNIPNTGCRTVYRTKRGVSALPNDAKIVGIDPIPPKWDIASIISIPKGFLIKLEKNDCLYPDYWLTFWWLWLWLL